MTIETQIVGSDGGAADVRRGSFNGRPSGILTYSEPIYDWKQRSLLFLDEDGSRDMAIDGSFSGTPDGVHDGTDSVLWTASATVGTWDFASTAQAQAGTKSIEALNMSNGDIATISKGSDLDFTNYVAVTGWIYITRFNDTTQEILFSFEDNSVIVGNTVNVIDYVDGSLLNTWQKFAIPKSDLGIGDVNVDSLVIQVVVNSGSAPRFYLDTIQIEETGGKKFTAQPSVGKIVQYNAIEFTFVDNAPLTVTDGTVPGLAYNQILGLASLTNGFTIQRFKDGRPEVSVNIKNICGLLSSTFDIINVGSDGTNSFLKMRVNLPTFSSLDSREDDRVEITINDDMSGLIMFRAIAIGRELIPYEG